MMASQSAGHAAPSQGPQVQLLIMNSVANEDFRFVDPEIEVSDVPNTDDEINTSTEVRCLNRCTRYSSSNAAGQLWTNVFVPLFVLGHPKEPASILNNALVIASELQQCLHYTIEAGADCFELTFATVGELFGMLVSSFLGTFSGLLNCSHSA